jgi:hypothetical protein|tara:strand:- start:135 stop:1064 length:930 start_codon:yes stop_codon:yes gene_type:complete
MALTYLSLTNDVITRMNEVALTAATFADARGVQIQCQNAVNESIRYINQKEFGYPFNHVTNTSTLVPGTVRYTVPTSTKHIDYNTARIKKDTDLNTSGGNLTKLDYNEYISRGFATQEDEVETTTLDGALTDSATTVTVASTTGFTSTGVIFILGEQISYTGITSTTFTGCTRGANSTTAASHVTTTQVALFTNGGVPQFIVRTPDNNYLLYPLPDKQYSLVFDYYTFPDDLAAHGDITSIPDRFSPIIVDGATAFVYQYRGELDQYNTNFVRFEQGIKNVQSLLVNKYEYVRSTVIYRPSNYNIGISF